MSDNNPLLLPKAVLRANLLEEVVKCFNEALFMDTTSEHDGTQPQYNECSKCHQHLDRVVYQCWSCSNMWLCSRCEEEEFHAHPASHIFLKKKIEQCDQRSAMELEDNVNTSNNCVSSSTVENGELFESTLDSLPTVTTDQLTDDAGLEDLVELAKWASEQIQLPPKKSGCKSKQQVDDGVKFNSLLDDPTESDDGLPYVVGDLNKPARMPMPGKALSAAMDRSDDVHMLQIDIRSDDVHLLHADHSSVDARSEAEPLDTDSMSQADLVDADGRSEAGLVDTDGRSEAGLVATDGRSKAELVHTDGRSEFHLDCDRQEWDVITPELRGYSNRNVNIEWCSDDETETSFSIIDPNERISELSDTSDDEDYEKFTDLENQFKNWRQTFKDPREMDQRSSAPYNLTSEPSASSPDSPTNHVPVQPAPAIPLIVNLPEIKQEQHTPVFTGNNQSQSGSGKSSQSQSSFNGSNQSQGRLGDSDQSQSSSGQRGILETRSSGSTQSESRQTDTLEDIAEMTIQAVQSAGTAMLNKWHKFIEELDEYTPPGSVYDDNTSREQTTPHIKQLSTNHVGLACLTSEYVPPQNTYIPRTSDWKPTSDEYKPRTTVLHRDVLDKEWIPPKPYQPKSPNYNYGMKTEV